MKYRRNSNRFQPDGAALFITLRLHGSSPLASGGKGPAWLDRLGVAECVTETIRDGGGARALYRLAAFVVMPNHVHLLIDPMAPAPRIARFVKGVSARRANALLRRTGRPFWQQESSGRWVRSPEERGNIIRHIEYNPVRANLAPEPQLFRYSSAFTG